MKQNLTVRVLMEALLKAIVNDDRELAEKLVMKNPALATSLVRAPRLYASQIMHWLYANDTALHLAAAGYRVDIAQILLRAGAEVNSQKNHRLGRPLHYAADGSINSPEWDAQQQVKTIACLLAAGADIDAQDRNGATPLHRAVRTRCAAAVNRLLDAGCDPMIKNKSGSTAFHLAVQQTGRGGSGAEKAKTAQKEIIQRFLALGVNTQLKDGKGKTVVACAQSAWVRELLL